MTARLSDLINMSCGERKISSCILLARINCAKWCRNTRKNYLQSSILHSLQYMLQWFILIKIDCPLSKILTRRGEWHKWGQWVQWGWLWWHRRPTRWPASNNLYQISPMCSLVFNMVHKHNKQFSRATISTTADCPVVPFVLVHLNTNDYPKQ